MDKQALRDLLKEQKNETLIKNQKLINEYLESYEQNLTYDADLLNGNISIQFCESPEEIRK